MLLAVGFHPGDPGVVNILTGDFLALGEQQDGVRQEEVGCVLVGESIRRNNVPYVSGHGVEADRFDEPARLDAFLNAARWGAITSADSQALQAPFRSGITIETYQLDPVVRALSMPRVNLLSCPRRRATTARRALPR